MTPGGAGDSEEVAHGSAVVLNGHGALIVGAAGAGKSALALALLGLGCGLIADDRTVLYLRDGRIWLRAPATLPPLIEARGIGLLPVVLAPPAPLIVVVDLDRAPEKRLPHPCQRTVMGHPVPVIAGQVGAHLAPALLQILTTGQVPHHG